METLRLRQSATCPRPHRRDGTRRPEGLCSRAKALLGLPACLDSLDVASCLCGQRGLKPTFNRWEESWQQEGWGGRWQGPRPMPEAWGSWSVPVEEGRDGCSAGTLPSTTPQSGHVLSQAALLCAKPRSCVSEVHVTPHPQHTLVLHSVLLHRETSGTRGGSYSILAIPIIDKKRKEQRGYMISPLTS